MFNALVRYCYMLSFYFLIYIFYFTLCPYSVQFTQPASFISSHPKTIYFSIPFPFFQLMKFYHVHYHDYLTKQYTTSPGSILLWCVLLPSAKECASNSNKSSSPVCDSQVLLQEKTALMMLCITDTLRLPFNS